ncbi:MAG: YceI family protein [Bacteroidota bacterium]
MRLIICLGLMMSLAHDLQSQDYFTRSGHVWFFSSTPAEDITAHNYQVLSRVSSDGQVQFAMLMKGFKFEKALMEEHFNEKYVESSQYPKAGFKGKVVDFSQVDLSQAGTYPVKVVGEMTIHGVTKSVEASGQFMVAGGQLRAEALFQLRPEDYGITLFSAKIAEVLDIHVDMAYELQNP